ncbi:calcium-binding protein [Pontivivens nitratireducens]|uniref:calcium-binding protein n=1 Tax=Pontivivens nitratireducens TaxID=2758038 RepID=UPI00163B4653|nr:calcium-binding protein [Pontibrevibacter nitratireducens]
MGKLEKIGAQARLGEETLAQMKAQMVPMEPRIMLDASLDLDTGGAAGLDIFHAVVGTLDAQTEELQSIFADYQNTLQQAVAVAGTLIDAGGDFDARGFDSATGGATDLARAQETAQILMSDIRDTVEAAKAAFEANLDTFVQANKATIAANVGTFQTAGANGISGDGDDVGITLTGADVEALLTFDNLVNNSDFDDAIEALIDGKVTAAVTNDDIEGLGSAVGNAAADEVTAAFFTLNLTDVQRDGADVVTFANETADKINVVVDMAALGLDLDVLLGAVDFGLDSTAITDALFADTTSEFSFDITKTSSASSIGLIADNFELPDLVAGGAVYDGAGSGPSTSLGFVSGTLEQIDTAQVRLATTGVDSISLSSTYNFGGALNNTFTADPISVAAEINEVGGAGFVSIVDDTTYRLIEVTIAGALDTQATSAVLNAAAFEAANQTERTFALVVGLESVLGTASDDAVAAFVDAATLDVASDFSGSIADANVRAAVEGAVDAFAAYGVAQMKDVLSQAVTQIQNFLGQSLFDVDLPFTDLSLRDALAPIQSVVDALESTFEIDLNAAGLAAGAALQPPLTSVTAGAPDVGAIVAQGTFDIALTDGGVDSTITVSGPFTDIASIAAAMDAALNAAGVGVSVDAAGRLVFTADVAGDDVLVDFVETDDLAIGDFGLIGAVSFAAATSVTTEEDIDVGELAGMEALVLNVTDGAGTQREVRVASDGGFASVADLAAKMDAALTDFNVSVTEVAGKLQYALDDPAGAAAKIQLPTENAVRAQTFDGLLAWANAQLNDAIPGVKITLGEDGRLLFLLPELQVMAMTGGSFNLDEIGFGDIAGLELNAALTALLRGELSTALAIDLAGLIGDADDALTARAENDGTLVTTGFADHVYVQDTSIFASISAATTSLTATADLGLVKAAIGHDTPTDNFIVLDAQMFATLTGEDGGTGDFDQAVSLSTLADKITAGRALDLLGRFELGGGAITTEDGDVVLDGANLKINNDIYANAFDAGEVGNVAVVHFGDVSIEVAGLAGLGTDAVNAVTVGARDLFDTDSWSVIIDSPVAEALTGLQTGDTLDTLTNIAGLLVDIGAALAEDLPFLDQDIPILNFSLLDVASFSEDFLAAVQDARNNPQGTLDTLDAKLEEVFGPDTVVLAWDATGSVLTFDLNLVYGTTGTTPLAIDLVGMLGDQLETLVGASVADVVTGLVDARGDAELTLTTDLILDLSFGIDLSGLLAEPVDFASNTTALGLLASVGSIVGANGNDLRVTRTDRDTGARSVVEIDLNGAETVDDVVGLIDAAVGTGFGTATLGDGTGDNVSFSYDAATGEFTFGDQDATARDSDDVIALFGAASQDSADDGGVQVVTASGAPGTPALAYAFDVIVNGESVTVNVPGDGARATVADLAEAINAAMQDADILRSAIDASAVPGMTVALSQLMRASEVGGVLVMTATDFAETQGYDPISFTLTGQDVSHEVTFEIKELDGANAARMLGFENGQELDGAEATSAAVYESAGDGKVRTFIDTDNTSIRFELRAGSEGSINAVLGLGPVEATVVGGTALIDAGDGSGDAARIGVELNDADGDAHDGQLDLSLIGDIANPLDLFIPEVQLGVSIDLPLTDNLGVLGDDAGFQYIAPLIQTKAGITAANFDTSDIAGNFEGDLIDFFENPSAGFPTTNVVLNLDGLEDAFADINVLGLLNDPRLVLNGLDLILRQTDNLIGGFLDTVNLPVIGDGLGAGLSVIDDMRYEVIAPALEYASQPKADGSLPTTVDLLTGFLNDQMNDLFGTSGVVYMQAFLDTSGGTNDSYLYGNFNFSGNLFAASLDAGFDIGIPGFELEFEDGTAIDLSVDYDANIAFGIDRSGFFLLNDEDEAEISIDFTVDAGNFAGSFTMANLLRLSAVGVDTANTNGSGYAAAPGEAGYDGGRIGVEASLSADLYGEQGTDMTRDLSGISVEKGGTALDWEKEVRLSGLRLSDLVAVAFTAEAFAEIQLTAGVINPVTGESVQIGGIDALPPVTTELIVEASFDTSRSGEMFSLDALRFEDVRLDASDLYEAFLAPIIDPLAPIIDPLAELGRALNTPPLSFAFGALTTVFPVLGIVDTIADIIVFVDDIKDSGGIVLFGTFDFVNQLDDLADGSARAGNLDSDDLVRTEAGAAITGTFGGTGLSIDLPIISDPSNVIALLLGNFEDVTLVRATYTLIDFAFDVDVVGSLVAASGLPSKVVSPITGALDARVHGHGFAGFTVGYDLSGVVNFIDTMQPERLFDGIFIDSSDGGLVDFGIGFEAEASISIAIASAFLRGSGDASFRLGFNDPNSDGKLRIPEIVKVVEAVADSSGFVEALELVFKGDGGFSFGASAGGSVGIGPASVSFSIDIFEFGTSFTFGGLPIPGEISSDIADTGNTAILNIGSRSGLSLTDATEDGDDRLVITGPNSPISVNWTSGGTNQIAGLDPATSAIIIPAGNGDNNIDMSGITDTTPTLTYTGSGDDNIVLSDQGFHVVFAGDGQDTITAGAGATGEYWIIGGGGRDTITVGGTGSTLIFSDDDYGLRDEFLAAFAAGGFNKAAAEAIVAGQWGDQNKTLDDFKTSYTQSTQSIAGSDADVVTVGSGDHVIFAGAGADSITTGGASGTVEIYGGAGDDTINGNGDFVTVEGGAGADRIFLGDGQNKAYGWSAQLSADGLSGDTALNTAASQDGADLIIGGEGTDEIWGHAGDDVIEGGGGDDLIKGNLGNDMITGGRFEVTQGGNTIDVAASTLHLSFPGVLVVDSLDLSDGQDTIDGHGGNDILLGGGEGDSITGGGGSDMIVGDFGQTTLSANRVVQDFTAAQVDSTNQGADTLTGGLGNDILIGGGASSGTVDVLTDLSGTGVLIGDYADIRGARLMEGVTQVTSVATSFGNADRITAGAGHDIILAGEGNDTVDAGLGTNIVSGDLAHVDLIGGEITVIATLNKFADSIISGVASDAGGAAADAADMIVGGSGDDTISAGIGRNAILGDDGTILFDAAARRAIINFVPALDASQAEADRVAADIALIEGMTLRLTATITDLDGDDVVTTLGDDDYAVLGGGDDIADLGEGVNWAAGDDGVLRVDLFQISSRSDSRGGDDSITTGAGNDFLVGGSGGDTITAGAGDNAVLGDVGDIYVSLDTIRATTLFSFGGSADGEDSVTALGGQDWVILGGDDDIADLGQGVNVVTGDTGSISNTGDARTAATIEAGDDTITTGDDIDIILGGVGSDSIIAGEGDNLIVGDAGQILFNITTFAALKLTSGHTGEDGDDTVTTGAGADIVILGGSDDTANVGDGFNRVLGDSGTVDIAAGTLLTESDLDSGDDSITGGIDQDIILAGVGADTVSAGTGSTNTILGDTGQVTYTVIGFGVSNIVGTSDVRDGADIITADGLINQVMGGGRDDTITLGNGYNVVLGDSGRIEPFAGLLLAGSDAFGGDDAISTGTSADVIIGGSGDDTISADAGDNSILGDTGEIRHGVFDFLGYTMLSTGVSRDGNDVVTTLGGNDLVILGGLADTADLGDGDNRVLGDSGTIETRNAFLTSATDIFVGADDITTGSGRDMIIGGSRADVIRAGAGDNAIIGDTGTINHDRDTLATLNMVSAFESDGADTVTALGGMDDVILGGGNDVADLGEGLNRVIGGSGEINITQGRIETALGTDGVTSNDDTITTGAANDLVIGGYGADTLTLGAGDNALLGDTGRILFDASDNRLISMLSDMDGSDGADRVTTLQGRDYAILGSRADIADLGEGDNIVVGEGGVIDLHTGTASTGQAVFGGNDRITTAGGADIVLGGSGADILTLGAGANLILGDSGTITFTATRAAMVLTSTSNPFDGIDTVTTTTGADVAILGGGGDVADLGANDNKVLADSGTINAVAGTLTNVSDIYSGADTVTTGGGADIVILGSGNDTLDGGAGDNLVLGDTGTISHQVGTATLIAMQSVTDTRDGRDTVRVLEGSDRIILGGNQDIAQIGAGDNWVLGDSGLIDRTTGTISSVASDQSGADRIVIALTGGVASGANTGNDIVIGGAGADEIDVSAGNNAVIGDSGTVMFAVGAETLISLTSTSDRRDGADTLRALEGDDIAILGGAADIANLGEGANRVIGDSGIVDVVGMSVSATSATYLDATPAASTAGDAGADTIITGAGTDLIIGGSRADTISGGNGDNIVLGDTGTINHDAAFALIDAVSLANVRDGVDNVTLGSGADAVILGGRGDVLNAGAGNNRILGDSGSIDTPTLTMTTASDNVAGADDITTGNGNDIILAGSGADTVAGGNGANVVLGDTGTVTHGVGGALETASSTADARDGVDTVTLGTGADAVILGGAGDVLNAGDGTNKVLGDSGSIDALTGTLTTESDIQAGADSITSGSGADIILAGSRADTVTGGAGDNLILAETGTILHTVGTTDLLSMVSAVDARDAADVITVLGGDDWIIAGGAGDSVAFGDGNNVVLGDSGSIDNVNGVIETVADDEATGDTLVIALGGGTSTGDDIVVGGGGADLIRVGAGDNTVLGDSGRITYTPGVNAILTVSAVTDLRDGNDTVTALGGDDIAILGGGADVIDTGDGLSRILGDSGTIDVAGMEITATVASVFDGADTITTGSGRDIILGGSASDTIDAGAGDNIAMGDQGHLTHDAALTLLALDATSDALDGDDTVTIGAGNSVIVLGGGSDTLNGGVATGDRKVLGDSGAIDAVGGSLTSGSDSLAGDDEIVLAGGSDMVIAGSGADNVTAAEGANLILGDTGTITHVAGSAAALVLRSVADTLDGADVVTSGSGDDIAILGGGADSLVTLGGANMVLADSGTVDTFTQTMTGDAADTDGADSVTAGTGDDWVFGGTGSDLLILGAGDNAAMGDSGVLTYGADVLTMTGNADARDGDDTVDAGVGSDSVILGGGADVAVLSAGDNIALGDSGTVDLVSGAVSTTADATDGADDIRTGGGVDIVAAGGADDVLTLGSGDNLILGDSGTILYNVGTRAGLSLTSTAAAQDGNDSIVAAGGADAIVAGGGADTVTGGEGTNRIIGDSGVIDFVAGTLTSTAADNAGADVIDVSNGTDIVIAGLRADVVRAGGGDNIVLSDGGTVSHDVLMALIAASSVADARDGADDVTSGLGDDVVILGGAADTLDAGDGDNRVLGDSGTVDSGTDDVLSGVSDAFAADDVITTGSGDDLVIAGAGSDLVTLGEGGNSLLGDTGTITVTGAGVRTLTSAADIRDGNDTITGGDGGNAIILGGGLDMATTGSGADEVIGDSGRLVFDAGRELFTTDAGIGAADILVLGGGDDLTAGGFGGDSVSVSGGNNAVLGDNGAISIIAGNIMLQSEAETLGGDDTLTTGAGDDSIVGGTGADSIMGGDGANRVLGDSGLYSLTAGAGALETMRGTDLSDGGADVITTGTGADRIIAGAGADTVTALGGDNLIIGDSGESIVSDTDTTVRTLQVSIGGTDLLTTGSGDDTILAGAFADTVHAGAGKDAVAGDHAELIVTTGEVFTSLDEAEGGDDILDLGAGDDVALGGAGADSINALSGENIVIGDSGVVVFDAGGFASASSSASGVGGADSITTGAGADRLIGGVGADTIRGGDGDNGVLGDEGSITSTAGLDTLRSTNDNIGGDDLIETGTGADAILGGAGADSITATGGDNMILGDAGTVVGASVGFESGTTSSASVGGVDQIVSGDGADTILGGAQGDEISAGAGGNVVLGDAGRVAGGVATSTDFTIGGDDRITTLGGGDILIGGVGNDLIDAGDGQNRIAGDNATIDAAQILDLDQTVGGADSITSGADADDIVGGAGADVIMAGAGNNRIAGDGARIDAAGILSLSDTVGGNDTITAQGGADDIVGGAGADSIDAGDGDNAILGDAGTIGADSIETATDGSGGDDLITSGSGDDDIAGGFGADVISAGAGANRIAGDGARIDAVGVASLNDILGGNDDITSDSGDDDIVGGAGDDLIDAGAGDNAILGDAGVITAGDLTSSTVAAGGDDVIVTGGGNDAIVGGAGSDTIAGGAGDNRVLGDAGSITASDVTDISGGFGGDDQITVLGGADTIMGGAGADLIAAGDGDNRIAGGAAMLTAADFTTIEPAGDGDDTITSGTGADIVMGGEGSDDLTTGAGDDLIAGDGATVVLSANVAMSATSRSSQGGAGDLIDGGDGDDTILGGAGADDITGGAGDDRLLGDFGTVDLITGALTSLDVDQGGDDTLAGGDGDDIVFGGAGLNVFSDTGGSNIVIAGSGGITGGSLVTLDITGPVVDQVLTGGAGNDMIFGGAGNDTIFGFGGNDTIVGDIAQYVRGVSLTATEADLFGDDVIHAGDGDDVVVGGKGSDTIDLGSGDDVAFGDMGDLTFGADGAVLTMVATQQGAGAADTIEGGAGNDLIFGQGGADLLTDISGSNIMIGDLASVTFLTTTPAPVGNGAADRVQTLATIRNDIAFKDVITGGSGRDLAVGGLGNDTLTGNGGQDLLFGDTIEMQRAYTLDTVLGGWVESIAMRTTLTGSGGNDMLISGVERDFVIADRGADFFETDFERNFVAPGAAQLTVTGSVAGGGTATLGVAGTSIGGSGGGWVSFIPSGLNAGLTPAFAPSYNGPAMLEARSSASYDTTLSLTPIAEPAPADMSGFATQSRLLSDEIARVVGSSAFVSEMAELQRYDLQHDMVIDSARASLLMHLQGAGLLNDMALFDALFDEMVMQMLEEILALDLDAAIALAAE